MLGSQNGPLKTNFQMVSFNSSFYKFSYVNLHMVMIGEYNYMGTIISTDRNISICFEKY